MFDGKAFGEQMVEVVKSYVDQATAPLLEKIAALEAREPIKGDPGEPGRDVDPTTLDEMIAAAMERVVASLRLPQDGKDGEPGAAVEPEVVAAMVSEAVERAVSAIPIPQDGKPGADGVGLAGAIIDRAGDLIVTLTNGETRSLGPVVGKDGQDGQPGARGERGFSLESFDTEMLADGRTILLKFVGAETAETHELQFPLTIYRGVFREGETYQSGDEVTWAGSAWHCAAETTEKPGEGSKAWLLKVKRGRDGKDFVGPVSKAPGKVSI